ncbi:DUF3291 domain-containing protein [Yoonia sp. R2331]|uniref:DUF3291 domain-containing protein n=1 Tax=Yoonia sp. R2331 TaxID=3237238 RepID=UPI0034E5B30D
MPLAEFNFGTLKYPWDDPRLKDFQDNLDRVNALAQRSDGFIWMLDEDGMDAVQNDPQGPLKDRPNTASTLSVWRDAQSLWQFVENTLHGRFMKRGSEWFRADDRSHLVIWEVVEGHRPTVAEGMARWEDLMRDGPSKPIFGGAELRRRSDVSAS